MFAPHNSSALAQYAQQLSLAAHLPVHLVASVASTNTALLADAFALPMHPQAPTALMALEQTAGRGRMGRAWSNSITTNAHAAPAFMASIGVRTSALLSSLALLPLHIGAAVAEQLCAWGCPAQLKWPNDLVIDTPQGSAKLGGILVESRSIDGALALVMGLGLNWHSAPVLGDKLTACAAPFARAAPDALGITAALLRAMQLAWQRTISLEPCDFARYDALLGKPVTAHQQQGSVIHGIAQGINAKGHLAIQTQGGVVWLHSGEVSIRLQP
jgi:biotin-[acetyl-CoA-carboxylase] ligase BirA-like protein